jgi:hypothetical protein
MVPGSPILDRDACAVKRIGLPLAVSAARVAEAEDEELELVTKVMLGLVSELVLKVVKILVLKVVAVVVVEHVVSLSGKIVAVMVLEERIDDIPMRVGCMVVVIVTSV